MLPAISRCWRLTGRTNAWRILWSLLSAQLGKHVPFRARSDAAHRVQPIQHALAAEEDLVVKCEREWALEARLVLRVSQQSAELRELVLQVQFPVVSGIHRRTYMAINWSTPGLR